MPGRNYINGSSYRYGFNGKETDSETGTQNYGYRIYNPSLGRFLSTDPVGSVFPFWSPYHFGANNPVWFIDFDGLQPIVRTGTYAGKTYTVTTSVEDPMTITLSSDGNTNTIISFYSVSKGKDSQEKGQTSLALLTAGTCCLINPEDEDYTRLISLVHGDINALKLLTIILAQNSDVSLVVIGNHQVPELKKRNKKSYDPRRWDFYRTKEEEYWNRSSERAFTLDRAQTVVNDKNLFNGKASAYSRSDVKTNEFPGVKLDPMGKGSRGVNILLDVSETKEAAPIIQQKFNKIIDTVKNWFGGGNDDSSHTNVRFLED